MFIYITRTLSLFFPCDIAESFLISDQLARQTSDLISFILSTLITLTPLIKRIDTQDCWLCNRNESGWKVISWPSSHFNFCKYIDHHPTLIFTNTLIIDSLWFMQIHWSRYAVKSGHGKIRWWKQDDDICICQKLFSEFLFSMDTWSTFTIKDNVIICRQQYSYI